MEAPHHNIIAGLGKKQNEKKEGCTNERGQILSICPQTSLSSIIIVNTEK